MITLPWLFAGMVTGLIIVSVFDPPKREIPSLPTPNDTGSFRTKTGCVTIKSTEVPCSGESVSLNVIAR